MERRVTFPRQALALLYLNAVAILHSKAMGGPDLLGTNQQPPSPEIVRVQFEVRESEEATWPLI